MAILVKFVDIMYAVLKNFTGSIVSFILLVVCALFSYEFDFLDVFILSLMIVNRKNRHLIGIETVQGINNLSTVTDTLCDWVIIEKTRCHGSSIFQLLNL